MGTVYAALHEKLGREVAIKVLNAELGTHGEAMQRFQREAELVTRLGHPNIVAVYDFGQSPTGAPYFVMEVVSGQTLRQRLEKGPLTDDEIIAIFAPLLSAVAAAHTAGVVHREAYVISKVCFHVGHLGPQRRRNKPCPLTVPAAARSALTSH